MSNEKVLKLSGRKAYWGPAPSDTGPIDPSRLPEGYPYKEQSEVVIEWDGNTTGKMSIDYNGMTMCKMSDATPNATEIIGGIVTLSDGTPFTIEEGKVQDANGLFMIFGDLPSPYVAVVPEDGFSLGGSTYPEKGIYFCKYSNPDVFTTGLTYGTETIHPMSEEFLPAGVGGGGVQRVTFTVEQVDTGYNFTCSHTGAEIAEMAAKGPVLADIQGMNVTAVLAGFVNGLAMFTFAMCHSDTATIQVISVNQNDGTGMNAAIQS